MGWDVRPTQGKGQRWLERTHPALHGERYHHQNWIRNPWRTAESFWWASEGSGLTDPILPARINISQFTKISVWWDISGRADSRDGQPSLSSVSLRYPPKLCQPFCNHFTLQTHLHLPISSLHAFRPSHDSVSWFLPPRQHVTLTRFPQIHWEKNQHNPSLSLSNLSDPFSVHSCLFLFQIKCNPQTFLLCLLSENW